ncbi:MAG: MBL fold metallo-hydrolase, partial [Clostridia bacterium]|nr:MBL fold metallo-hydrolase [Clostridia bacterium]
MARKIKHRRNLANRIGFWAFPLFVLVIVFIIGVNYKKEDDKTKAPIEEAEVGTVATVQDLKVTFIDVGQGDSILINFPDGKNMLIDTGTSGNKKMLDSYLTVGGEKLKLDYVVATHSDADHIGCMDYIYENYEVGYSYRPYIFCTHADASAYPSEFNKGVTVKNSNTATYFKYINGVYKKTYNNWEFFSGQSDFTVKFKTEDSETEYEYAVDFLMPYAESVEGFKRFEDPNDFSAVIMVTYNGKKILFTGDMGNQNASGGSEKAFTDYYTDYSGASEADCDILKVGHHGSKYSSSVEFLNVVKPENAIISCGSNKTYKHPTVNALMNLTAALIANAKDESDGKLYRTDLQGSITLTISSESGEAAITCEISEYNAHHFEPYEDVV